MAREALMLGEGNEAERQRRAEEREAEQKEQRIEHLTQMAARRMGKKELSMGWQAWSESYWEGARRRRLLAQAGSKLARPKLVSSYARWRHDWVEAE